MGKLPKQSKNKDYSGDKSGQCELFLDVFACQDLKRQWQRTILVGNFLAQHILGSSPVTNKTTWHGFFLFGVQEALPGRLSCISPSCRTWIQAPWEPPHREESAWGWSQHRQKLTCGPGSWPSTWSYCLSHRRPRTEPAPSKGARNTVGDDPSTWVPAILTGDRMKLLILVPAWSSSGSHVDSESGDGRFLCLLSLCSSHSQINKYQSKIYIWTES